MLEEMDLGDMGPSPAPTPQPSTVWSRGAHPHGHAHAHDADHDANDSAEDEGTHPPTSTHPALYHLCFWTQPYTLRLSRRDHTVVTIVLQQSLSSLIGVPQYAGWGHA